MTNNGDNVIDFAVCAGGPAGTGIITIGETLGKLFQRMGWYVFTHDKYQSIIKGGHNAIYTRICEEQIYAHRHDVDILIALDKLSIERHINELTEKGVVIYNKKAVSEYNYSKTGIGIDFEEMATKCGNVKYSNMVAVGCVLALIDESQITLNYLEKILEQKFGKKGKEVVEGNMNAVRAGYNFVKENNIHVETARINPKDQKNHLFLTGNQAIVLGAIKAGVKLLAQYPMTPASSILDTMASYELAKNIVVRQPEDELACMNMIVGAGAAGIRALTATSGGGFSLMVEALGFAAIAEVPCVIVESQRSGPSTGMPTHHDQADLRFVMHASQGDFPRIVITPGCVSECFYLTYEAFNLAEKYQTPVIILVDKYLSSSFQTVDYFKMDGLKIDRGALLSDEEAERVTNYKRYLVTESGISPRIIPGQKNGMHVDSSYEHDETGYTTEDPIERDKQVLKRARKLENFPEEISSPKIYGNPNANVAVVCWGSTKMPAQEAIKILKKEGIEVAVVHYRYVLPFPVNKTLQILSKYDYLVNVECNYSSQFHGVLKEFTGIDIPKENNLNKFNGDPVHPIEIANKVKEILKKKSLTKRHNMFIESIVNK
ncbi:MAG: 2-oxoacid:acceptor oxidoreductase subunit alpha [Candidatus Micrarchaeota archaeon]|nr:2-oxoacid:acceptor oxidoreductase subunit alpha [Candidatus Micrarchaeota archaeon]